MPSIAFTDSTGAATITSLAPRFRSWSPDIRTIGPREPSFATGILSRFGHRTDYIATFEATNIAHSEQSKLVRLKDHLLGGGSCTVTTGDLTSNVYTCYQDPEGADPSWSLDGRNLEFTLALAVKNSAAAALECIYDDTLSTPVTLPTTGGASIVKTGTGSPEGSVTGIVGTAYLQQDAVNASPAWGKHVGSGSTGWLRYKFDDGVIDPRVFGLAVAASAATNTTALLNAIGAAEDLGGAIVHIPDGEFTVDPDDIVIAGDHVCLRWAAGALLRLTLTASAASVVRINSAGATTPITGVRLINPRIDANDSVDTKLIRATYAHDLEIVGGLLYGVSTTSAASAAGIWVEGTAGSTLTVSSITRSGRTATVTTSTAHGLTTGDMVRMLGADQGEYTGVFRATVTSTTVFTITVDGIPVTPATGTMTCFRLYLSRDLHIERTRIRDIADGVVPDAIHLTYTENAGVVGTRVSGGGRAIYLVGPNVGASLVGNRARDVEDNAFRINPATAGTGTFNENIGHTLSGNVALRAGIDGFRLNGKGLTVTANTAIECGEAGFKSDVLQDATVNGNAAIRNGTDGFVLYKTTGVNEVSGPHRDVSLDANLSIENGQYGYRVLGGGVSGTDLASGLDFGGANLAKGNAAGGVGIFDAEGVLIGPMLCRDNTNGASSSDKAGIYVDMTLALTSSKGITIRGPRCYETRASGNRQTKGVYIRCGMAGATLNRVIVDDPDVSDSVSFGVQVDGTGSGTLGAVTLKYGDASNAGAANAFSVRTATDRVMGIPNRQVAGLSVSGTRGDVAVTLTVGSDARIQRWTAALTVDRAVSLSATAALPAARFRILRESTSTGAFNLNVNNQAGTLLKALAVSTWAEVEYDGSNWILVGYGAL